LGSQDCHREPDVGNEHAYCEPLCSQWDNDTVGFQILPGSKAFCPIFLHGVEVAVQLFDQRLQRAVRKFKKYIHVFLLQSLSRYFLGKSHCETIVVVSATAVISEGSQVNQTLQRNTDFAQCPVMDIASS